MQEHFYVFLFLLFYWVLLCHLLAFMLSLCWVLQLSGRISVESESLFGFSAGVVKGHLRDVLVAEKPQKNPQKPQKSNDLAIRHHHQANLQQIN